MGFGLWLVRHMVNMSLHREQSRQRQEPTLLGLLTA